MGARGRRRAALGDADGRLIPLGREVSGSWGQEDRPERPPEGWRVSGAEERAGGALHAARPRAARRAPREPGAWAAMLAGVVRDVARNRRRRHDRARPHEPLDAEALESWYEGVMKQVVQSRGKGYM